MQALMAGSLTCTQLVSAYVQVRHTRLFDRFEKQSEMSWLD